MDKPTYTVDKSNWVRSPWDNEPDLDYWMNEAGFTCTIVRTASAGSLCGYVGVPMDHPAFGHGYDDEVFDGISVHGGLTYAGRGRAKFGENPDHWYVGFDCAHAGDYMPGPTGHFKDKPELDMFLQGENETYRTFQYVKEQVESLAEQLEIIGKGLPWDGEKPLLPSP